MKKSFLVFYTIFSSVILLGAAVYFIFSLCNEYANGNERISANYNRVISTLQTSDNLDLSSKTFSDNLENAIGDLNNYSYLDIEYNGIKIYSYPSINATPQKTNLTEEHKQTVSKNQGDFEVHALLYLIRPTSIAYYARNAFFIVLIITLITFIVIICEKNSTPYIRKKSSLSDKDERLSVSDDDIEYEEDFSEEENDDEVYEENSIAVEEPAAPVATAPISAQIEQPAQTSTSETKNDVYSLGTISDKKEEHQKVEQKLPYEEEKPVKIEGASDKDLYSPLTGIGWETYLVQRMDKEIERAISSEIDLAVFVFKIPLLARNSNEIKNICNYLTLQFQFKDLLFEYKNDSIVALKIGLDLDKALEFAEKLYSDISNILQDTEAKCYIGISTRSIRIVSGERILTEAEEASIHAQEDADSPIIAFRVDAEKYRKFLEQQNA